MIWLKTQQTAHIAVSDEGRRAPPAGYRAKAAALGLSVPEGG